MKKVSVSLILAVAIGLLYLSSCKTKKEVKAACTSSPTYTADIKSILDANCMPCHSAEKHKHNIDLSSYETAKESAQGKNFLGAIRHEAGYDAMPPPPKPPLEDNKRLSDDVIEKLACWIQNGMPK